jgi:hypothetical protein
VNVRLCSPFSYVWWPQPAGGAHSDCVGYDQDPVDSCEEGAPVAEEEGALREAQLDTCCSGATGVARQTTPRLTAAAPPRWVQRRRTR